LANKFHHGNLLISFLPIIVIHLVIAIIYRCYPSWLKNVTLFLSGLSKSEKKISRAAFDKVPDSEYWEGLENFEAIINNLRAGKFADNKEAYYELFKHLTN